MHLVQDRESKPIEDERELVAYFTEAGKPAESWRVGTEREMIGVYKRGPHIGQAPHYEGPHGIGALLERLGSGQTWEPVRERGNIIALTCADAQVTIEPGGQLELAARPVLATADYERDLCSFADDIAEVSEEFDISWLGLGFRPFGRIDEVGWMPKERYAVMRAYMPTRGALAHEMMKRTATAQVNLDFSDPDDAGEKMRAAMGAGFLLTALYANSPIVDGADSGHQSYRARIWRDTDPDRCGLLPFVFEDGDVFAGYTQWALDVPLFFVYRQGYKPAGGMTFRRFLREGFEGHRATLDDWALHLSTLFPEVRMKKYLELRGCDSSARDLVIALGPLSRGFLYDREARRATIALTEHLSFAERVTLLRDVAERGLAAQVPGSKASVGEMARSFLDIAADGLARQDPAETAYLAPLREIAETGRSQADAFRDLWTRTQGDPARIIEALSHTR